MLDFLDKIKWWILLAIMLLGFVLIYWGDR